MTDCAGDAASKGPKFDLPSPVGPKPEPIGRPCLGGCGARMTWSATTCGECSSSKHEVTLAPDSKAGPRKKWHCASGCMSLVSSKGESCQACESAGPVACGVLSAEGRSCIRTLGHFPHEKHWDGLNGYWPADRLAERFSDPPLSATEHASSRVAARVLDMVDALRAELDRPGIPEPIRVRLWALHQEAAGVARVVEELAEGTVREP